MEIEAKGMYIMFVENFTIFITNSVKVYLIFTIFLRGIQKREKLNRFSQR